MWGPCIGPPHEAAQRVPHEILCFSQGELQKTIVVTLLIARHFTSANRKASPLPNGWKSA